MNKYELAVRLNSKSTPAKKKSFLEKIEKIVSLSKGKLGKTEEKVSDAGIFLFIDLELDTAGLKNLQTKVKLDEEIEKYLVLRK